MNPEHETTDPFWTHDVLLAEEVPLRDGPELAPKLVRARLHLSDEKYPRQYGSTEILPISDEPGTRRYVLAHPYLLVPDITLQIGLYPHPRASGAIGEVVGSHWEGMRHVQIGSAQAWYYERDHTIVLWELLLNRHFRRAGRAPADDAVYLTLWHGFEREMCARFPDAQQIATPSWDPDYSPAEWHRLLTTLGYRSATPQAFLKAVPAPNG